MSPSDGFDPDGHVKVTELFDALYQRNEELVEFLLSMGADPNGENPYTPADGAPLLVASNHGLTEAVKALLDNYADITQKNARGQTALLMAQQGGAGEIMQLLLERGADPDAQNEDGDTALINAVRAKNPEEVRMLLAAGADISLKNNEGKSALDFTKEYDLQPDEREEEGQIIELLQKAQTARQQQVTEKIKAEKAEKEAQQRRLAAQKQGRLKDGAKKFRPKLGG